MAGKPIFNPVLDVSPDGVANALLSVSDIEALRVESGTPSFRKLSNPGLPAHAIEAAATRAWAMSSTGQVLTAFILFPFHLCRKSSVPCLPWTYDRRVLDPQAVVEQLTAALKLPDGMALQVLSDMEPLDTDLSTFNSHGLLQMSTIGGAIYSSHYEGLQTLPDIEHNKRLLLACRQLILVVDIPRDRAGLLLQLQRCVLDHSVSTRVAVSRVIRRQVQSTWIRSADPRDGVLLPYGFAGEISTDLFNAATRAHIHATARAAAVELGVALSTLEFDIHFGPLATGNQSRMDSLYPSGASLTLHISVGVRSSTLSLMWEAAVMAYSMDSLLPLIHKSLLLLHPKCVRLHAPGSSTPVSLAVGTPLVLG